MISGSYMPEELRRATMTEIVAQHRIVARCEKRLSKKKYTRQYRNPECDAAKRQREDRNEIISEMKRATDVIFCLFVSLPEVRQDKTLQLTGTAMRYAAQLAKPKPRKKKFLKNQLTLAE